MEGRKLVIERDTYKYHLKLGSRTILRGITSDLKRKEEELQIEYPGSHIEQIGRLCSLASARLWESKGGKRQYKKET
jgi:hypothetical protein